jgi:tetratricopeptide (TPR) repeat protein
MCRPSPSVVSTSDSNPRWVVALVAALTAVVFTPAIQHGFLEWDDAANLVSNPGFRGFTPAHLSWMFTAGHMGHYIPITWLSFALDHAIGGMSPVVYHVTNIVLHAANAALFYLLARRLLLAATGHRGMPLAVGAVVSALFFGVHPLRAESVAWITERRDVLSGFFTLLAVLGYLRAIEAEGRARTVRFALSIAAYVLALGAKSIVMTLPLILLVLDVYPLRRLDPSPGAWRTPAAWRIWREKIPYALAALATAVVAYLVVHANTVVTPLDAFPPGARVFVILYGLAFYVSRTAIPIGLSPLYELPSRVDPLTPAFALSTLAVIAGLVLVAMRRRPWPAAPWLVLAYGAALAPVLGVVHAGHQLAHDRYSYLSCLGWALLVGAAASALAGGAMPALRPAFRRAALAAVGAWLVALAALTWSQVQLWRDDVTLWQTAVDVEPDCSICHSNLGVAYYKQSQLGGAQQHLERALSIRADRLRARYNLALTLIAAGRPADAVPHLQQTLELAPGNALALEALGAAWIAQRRYVEALPPLREAAARGASGPAFDTHLALTLHELGRSPEAIPLFRRAMTAWPDATPPRLGLLRAYLAVGDRTAARGVYEGLAALDAKVAARVNAGLPEPFTKEDPGGHVRTP